MKEDLIIKMEGLDKRTLEYKSVKKEYDLLVYTVQDDVYNKVTSYEGRVPSEDVSWLFDTHNDLFNTKYKKCHCPGVVKKMIAKIKVTYERERK